MSARRSQERNLLITAVGVSVLVHGEVISLGPSSLTRWAGLVFTFPPSFFAVGIAGMSRTRLCSVGVWACLLCFLVKRGRREYACIG